MDYDDWARMGNTGWSFKEVRLIIIGIQTHNRNENILPPLLKQFSTLFKEKKGGKNSPEKFFFCKMINIEV